MHRSRLFNFIKRIFPIWQWITLYNSEKAISDVIAGVTVGLTLIPQSIAYAALAGLEPQYGLYSSLSGGMIYVIFGTIPELNIAPTALLSLLTFSYTHNSPFGAAPAAVLLCFYSGIIEICCGILHLGFLVDFVSIPVVAGLTSAGAVLIATAQVKNLLGLNFKAEKFIDIWINVAKNIKNTNHWDAVLSACCCVLLLSLRKLGKFGSPPLSSSKDKPIEERYKILKKIIWFLSVGRNALIVFGCATVAYILKSNGYNVLSLTGKVPYGLPNVSFVPTEIFTNNHTYTFVEMTSELGTGIIVLPFIAILANVAISKAFSQGKVLDASQEMLAVGVCNIAGSFLSSFPVNASFSRAAVSNASGVRTTFSGIYTGTLVILSLTFLTPYFVYIPKATLASVIICAVAFMVEVTTSKLVWKINKIDLFPLTVTFVACLLLGIEIGILIGIAVDILLLLYYISRPRIDVQKVVIEGIEYTKIIPASSVYFPSAEYVRDRILKINGENEKRGRVIIIDCSKISKTDFTTSKCLGALADDLRKTGRSTAFLKLEPTLTKIIAKTCHRCIFAFTDDALTEILKERRHSDLLDNYKNINVQNGSIKSVFENCDATKL